MDTKALIERAKALLVGTSPAPWWVGDLSLFDATNYIMITDVMETDPPNVALIVAAPTIIRELVEALEEADANLTACLMREQANKEEMESWMDKAIRAEKTLENTPKVSIKITGRGKPTPVNDSELGICCEKCGLAMIKEVCPDCADTNYSDEDLDYCWTCTNTGVIYTCPVCDKEGKADGR